MLRDAPQGLAAVTLSRFQSTALVLLRTLIGWHFLYEGYYKLVLPGWTRVGDPVAADAATRRPLSPLYGASSRVL